MIPGNLTTAQVGSRTLQCPCDAGSVGMEVAGVKGSWRLSQRFQREAWEARQILVGLESLWVTHERVMHKAVGMKPKLEWRPPELSNATIVEHL